MVLWSRIRRVLRAMFHRRSVYAPLVYAVLALIAIGVVTRNPVAQIASTISGVAGLSIGLTAMAWFGNRRSREGLQALQKALEANNRLQAECDLLGRRLERADVPAMPTPLTVLWFRADDIGTNDEPRFVIDMSVDQDRVDEDRAMDLIAMAAQRVPAAFREWS